MTPLGSEVLTALRSVWVVECDPPKPGLQSGPTGLLALGLAAAGYVLAFCVWPTPGYFRPPEIPLIERAVWCGLMVVPLGVSVASIRRGPPGTRWAAYLALAVSLLGVGGVLMGLGRITTGW